MSGTDPTWTFSLVVDGIEAPTSEAEDALFEAGCDDALLVVSQRSTSLDFDRVATTFEEAVLSALADVGRAGCGVTVLRVEPDDLVSAADIARRADVSREATRKWIDGARGGGGFPTPVASVGRSPVWSWCEVAAWLKEHGHLADADLASAKVIAAMNQVLERRRMAERTHHERRLERELKKLSA